MLIKSELQLGYKQHGELCPQEWVYHYYDFSDSDDDEDFGLRHAISTDLTYNATNASNYTIDYATHLRLHIWKYTGASRAGDRARVH